MEKIYLIIALMFISNSVIYPQDALTFGVKIQSEFNKLSIEQNESSNVPGGITEEGAIAAGFSIGGLLEWQLNDNLFIRTGMDLDQANFKRTTLGFRFGPPSDEPQTYINRYRFYSLEIPISIGVRLESKEKVRYNVGLGGSGIKPLAQHGRSKVVIDSESEKFGQKGDIDQKLNPFALMFFGGIEYQLNNGFVIGLDPHIKLSPNRLDFVLFQTEGISRYTIGITTNLKF